MNSNKVKRFKAIKLLAAFYAQEKRVHTAAEYIALGHRQPVTGSTIKYVFGGYPGAMTMLKQSAFWSDLEKYAKVVPENKPVVEKPQVKVPKLVASVKPAPKVAVKEGKDNE
tara:strand:+ start:158 stop:493 length:336 start_codon:yes stop_codon:yes gene_type:complete